MCKDILLNVYFQFYSNIFGKKILYINFVYIGIQLTLKKLIMKKERSLSILNVGITAMMNGFAGTVLIYVL